MTTKDEWTIDKIMIFISIDRAYLEITLFPLLWAAVTEVTMWGINNMTYNNVQKYTNFGFIPLNNTDWVQTVAPNGSSVTNTYIVHVITKVIFIQDNFSAEIIFYSHYNIYCCNIEDGWPPVTGPQQPDSVDHEASASLPPLDVARLGSWTVRRASLPVYAAYKLLSSWAVNEHSQSFLLPGDGRY